MKRRFHRAANVALVLGPALEADDAGGGGGGGMDKGAVASLRGMISSPQRETFEWRVPSSSADTVRLMQTE